MIHEIVQLRKINESRSLFHYTKSKGIQGIITDKCIRATRSDFLNDTSEANYILTVLDMIIEDIGNESWRSVLRKMIRERLHTPREVKYYIASFSTDPDSITLWSEFGDHTGYNAAFESTALLAAIQANQKVSYHGYVIYSVADQKKLLKNALADKIPKVMSQSFEEIMDEAVRDITCEAFEKYCKILEKVVGIYSIFFKQEEFAVEQEYRVALREKDSKNVRFRENGGFMVPYVLVDISSGKAILPIESITVAPKNHIDLAQEGMREYMKYNGYDVNVKLSRIKLRY